MTCTQDRFERDVAAHQMTVLHEEGVYRHIRFGRPDSSSMHFDLITYPGYLVYSGDMGCYVFSRLRDMFEFFRTDRLDTKDPSKLHINRGYWSEKLEAVDGNRRQAGATEFSPEKFRQVIKEYRLRWVREYRYVLDKEQRRELWKPSTTTCCATSMMGSTRPTSMPTISPGRPIRSAITGTDTIAGSARSPLKTCGSTTSRSTPIASPGAASPSPGRSACTTQPKRRQRRQHDKHLRPH